MPSGEEIPSSYYVGQEIDWDAPWLAVRLWVELPFWLMVGNAPVTITLNGHKFDVTAHEEYFELHIGGVSDSKGTVIYRGPLKEDENLSNEIRELLQAHPKLRSLWRKCKTVLKITSRCNQDVLAAANERDQSKKQTSEFKRKMNGVRLYLSELCKAHIPVVNELVRGYRLATYDYFPYEVSPWDVPYWQIEHNGGSVSSCLVPYRDWDFKPRIFTDRDLVKRMMLGQQIDPASIPYKLIDESNLQDAMSLVSGPGELELLDALNFMERGGYSDAVRRITTALEVIVESEAGKVVEKAEGEKKAASFLKATESNFRRRVDKYEQFSGRTLSAVLKSRMYATRQLRHRIVHAGHRIGPSDLGQAQRAVDTGRWIYNWFENDKARREVREKKIAFRSLGRDIMTGIFPAEIIPDGVVLSKSPR